MRPGLLKCFPRESLEKNVRLRSAARGDLCFASVDGRQRGQITEYVSIVYLSAHECNTVIIHELNKILLVHKYSLPKYGLHNARFMGLGD